MQRILLSPISYRSKFSLFCYILRLGAFASCIFVITSFIHKLNHLCAVLKTTLLSSIKIRVDENSKLNPLAILNLDQKVKPIQTRHMTTRRKRPQQWVHSGFSLWLYIIFVVHLTSETPMLQSCQSFLPKLDYSLLSYRKVQTPFCTVMFVDLNSLNSFLWKLCHYLFLLNYSFIFYFHDCVVHMRSDGFCNMLYLPILNGIMEL